VKVYHDPYTRLKPEGEAVLISRACRNADGSEDWLVLFFDDEEGAVHRTIVPQN